MRERESETSDYLAEVTLWLLREQRDSGFSPFPSLPFPFPSLTFFFALLCVRRGLGGGTFLHLETNNNIQELIVEDLC